MRDAAAAHNGVNLGNARMAMAILAGLHHRPGKDNPVIAIGAIGKLCYVLAGHRMAVPAPATALAIPGVYQDKGGY